MNDSAHVFTLGIEEEFQIIDPETRGSCVPTMSRFLSPEKSGFCGDDFVLVEKTIRREANPLFA